MPDAVPRTVHCEVDDRSATWWTRRYVVGMRVRRDKQAFEGAGHTATDDDRG